MSIPRLRNRRQFFNESCCGIGSLALASMMADERLRAGSPLDLHPRRLAQITTLSSSGQVGHLSLYGRWTKSPGYFRSQAAIE